MFQINGFYVESGGYTGEALSNTLFFETQRDWQGILIEPDDTNFKKLLTKNRKTFSAHSCLAESNKIKNVVEKWNCVTNNDDFCC